MSPQHSPNILFIFPDQWRGDCLGSLGHPTVETPYLDQLASEGITFSSAYSPSPSCIPARACLMTGKRPYRNGRIGYRDGIEWTYQNTFAHCLQRSGYETLCVGKTHFYPQRAKLGFEEIRLYDPQNLHGPHVKSDYHIWLEEHTGGKVKDSAITMSNNAWLAAPWVEQEHYHPTNWTTDTATKALERRDPTRPFFLQVSYHRPHPPYDPPLHYYERYLRKELPNTPIGDWVEPPEKSRSIWTRRGQLSPENSDAMKRAYFASITHIDDQIGRLFWWMKRNMPEELENTWIVFSSDHGELLGDHYMYGKFNAFEGSAKIPLIIKPPLNRKINEGEICKAPVSLCDLMPSFLEMAQAKCPDDLDGQSLLPLIESSVDREWREHLHGEHAGSSNGAWQFVTDGKWKYAVENTRKTEYLFDLQKDPQECNNLAYSEEYSDTLDQWRKALEKHLEGRVISEKDASVERITEIALANNARNGNGRH